MLTELRLYLRARRYLKQLEVLFAMPLTWSTILQILTVAGTAIGELSPLLTSPKAKVAAATAGGLITVILHNYAGNRNPDGTPASVAYVPPDK